MAAGGRRRRQLLSLAIASADGRQRWLPLPAVGAATRRETKPIHRSATELAAGRWWGRPSLPPVSAGGGPSQGSHSWGQRRRSGWGERVRWQHAYEKLIAKLTRGCILEKA